mgnify:FL=1|tara:strand:+ start:7738 stop:9015 length:1278 start_codon:yes stop_codon:yes gene_type:complete
MKQLLLATSLLAAATGAHALTDLNLDEECNYNGTAIDINYPWVGGVNYVYCELPTTIAVDDEIELLEESDSEGKPILWALPGIVTVGDGYLQGSTPATADSTRIYVDEGVNIVGAVPNSALVITRGAQIEANGSANAPVVFSSLDTDFTGEGEWGGLILSGFGDANECNSGADTCIMEGISAGYYFGGGLSTTASSGSLEYVVITEGGVEINVDDPDPVANGGNEINGLTLYAVNDTTIINRIHVNENLDDGIEFFGGDVDVRNVWLTCNGDDSVDWDYGYHGTIQNIYIEQGDKNGSEDYAFELAGNPNNAAALPLANGTVSNAYVEFKGDRANVATLTDAIFKLKEGTSGSFDNIKIVGYASSTPSQTPDQDCDDIDSTNITSANFGRMTYDCTVVDGSKFVATGLATFNKTPTFWAAAPTCN